MRHPFADTQWWVALAVLQDPWALPVRRIRRTLTDVILVTTDEVLVEFIGFVSGHGAHVRINSSRIVRETLDDPKVRVILQTRDTLLEGLDLFEARPDKGYSLVDCISMVTMRRLGMTEVLTADRHFEQEGFVAVLREAAAR